MVRPPTRQLSALKFPCAKPTRSQLPMSDAIRTADSPKKPTNTSLVRPPDGTSKWPSKWGYSREIAWDTSSSSCLNSRDSAPPLAALLENRSRCPMRVKDGETRQVIAHVSSTIMSGSAPERAPPFPEYHGRLDFSPPAPPAPDWTRLSARVVGTPRACMCSDARNSRTELRSTARPSAPRQKGVRPPPLSCSSHRRAPSTPPGTAARRVGLFAAAHTLGAWLPPTACGPRASAGTSTSPTLTARPSP
mmetsp:Transcript_65941/g.148834  ORF Transcript_65941/g.148834 Transcript_65941/m.148834 type:complete len:248 (-) Transcript_65941:577-1320(-)